MSNRWLLQLLFTKTKRISLDSELHGTKVSRFFSGFIFVRIRAQRENFLYRIRFFTVNDYYESKKCLWIAYESGEIWSSANVALIRMLDDFTSQNPELALIFNGCLRWSL